MSTVKIEKERLSFEQSKNKGLGGRKHIGGYRKLKNIKEERNRDEDEDEGRRKASFERPRFNF